MVGVRNWFGDAKMPAQTIARTAGNDAERAGGVNKGGGDFVERAIAANRNDQLNSATHSGRGECRGMLRMGGRLEGCIQLVLGDEAARVLEQVGVADVVTRTGIKNERRADASNIEGSTHRTSRGRTIAFGNMRAILIGWLDFVKAWS